MKMEKKLLHGGLFKRVLSLALTLVMLLSLMPMPSHAAEGDTTVYLKPNKNWLNDGARFAIYYYSDSANGWTDMSDADSDGYYEGTVPAGYTSVIFCRMNPAATENDWANKWNQTDDLPLPTDGGNCYTVAEETWDKGGGTWSKYPTAPTDPTPTPTPTYTVAGDAGLCGSVWDPTDAANKMDLKDGLNTITYQNVAAGSYSFKVTDGSWANSWGKDGTDQNVQFNVTEACDVPITFNADTKEIDVSGTSVSVPTELVIDSMYAVGNGSGAWLNGESWNAAAAANKMTETSSGVYEITYRQVPKGEGYEVKFAANGKWADSWGGTYTTSGEAADAAYNGSNIALTVEPDYADVTLKLDLTGFDYGTKQGAKVTITIKEVAKVDYYLFG